MALRKYTIVALCATAMEIHKAKGVLNDLVKRYSDCADDPTSEGFAKDKSNITQILTNTRKELMSRLIKLGKTEDEAKEIVATKIPNFRAGRMTGKKEQLDELFGLLDLAVGDEEEDEEEMEDVDRGEIAETDQDFDIVEADVEDEVVA